MFSPELSGALVLAVMQPGSNETNLGGISLFSVDVLNQD
jgi:hypothetical protein